MWIYVHASNWSISIITNKIWQADINHNFRHDRQILQLAKQDSQGVHKEYGFSILLMNINKSHHVLPHPSTHCRTELKQREQKRIINRPQSLVAKQDQAWFERVEAMQNCNTSRTLLKFANLCPMWWCHHDNGLCMTMGYASCRVVLSHKGLLKVREISSGKQAFPTFVTQKSYTDAAL